MFERCYVDLQSSAIWKLGFPIAVELVIVLNTILYRHTFISTAFESGRRAHDLLGVVVSQWKTCELIHENC